MKVLVTGMDGYLGSLLAPLLVEEGFDVTGVDTGFYRERLLCRARGPMPRLLLKDIRRITAEELAGQDAVVHMAELSNDPVGELTPARTYEINHKGTVRLAELAKSVGVRRFIYMSSCSVYGVAGEDLPVTETSAVNPQTTYAICKVLCERDLLPMADNSFSPVFFRNATAYGASPHQRFDLVVNNLCGLAHTTGKIQMVSDGTPWRPLVHGLDIARAILAALRAPVDAIHGEAFNIGDSRQNYRVREIAEIIGGVFKGCEICFGQEGKDNRSYRVNFDKVRRHLPEFQCCWDVAKGARQLHALFNRIEFTSEAFNFRSFTRIKQLQYLIRTEQIDDSFYWREEV